MAFEWIRSTILAVVTSLATIQDGRDMSFDELEGIITIVELVYRELLVAEVVVNVAWSKGCRGMHTNGFVFPKRIAGS